MATDCRIGARQDFVITSGETWWTVIKVLDKNGDVIPLDNATITLIIFKVKPSTPKLTIANLDVSGNQINLKQLIDLAPGKYKYVLPIVLNGTTAVPGGELKVERFGWSTFVASQVINLRLNAVYDAEQGSLQLTDENGNILTDENTNILTADT